MTTLEKIISPSRKDYATACDNGSYKIDSCEFAIFDYTHKYIKIPGCPAPAYELRWSGFTDKEIETTWLGFRKFAKKFADESSPIQLKTASKEYRYCNKYVALYNRDAIIVFKHDGKISLPDVLLAGFNYYNGLAVPFSEEHTAYYDVTNDTLICGW